MKKIIYRAIFGENWGSGHLNRAIAFASHVADLVEVQLVLERESDHVFADRYGIPYTVCRPDQAFGVCDLVIDDTLGLFPAPVSGATPVWVIDGLHAADRTPTDTRSFWSLLYEQTGRSFPAPEVFFKRPAPCAAIFQGGADDHHQIEVILNKLPREHRLLIGVGSNCRHIEQLTALCAARGGAQVLVDFDVTRIARAADYVITSGGNILFELLYNAQPRNLVLYSKEHKEHLTFAQVLKHSQVVYHFTHDSGFEYREDFLRNVGLATNQRRNVSDIEALCQK